MKKRKGSWPGWLKLGVLGVMAAIVLSIYAGAFATKSAGVYHDDGVYLVTAKALAEGKGYMINSLPEPIPQTKYPVLWSGLLALGWKLNSHFPQNLAWLRILPLTCTLAWLVLAWRWIRRETEDVWLANLGTLLIAANTWTIFLGTQFLSEMLFATLLTALALVLAKVEQKPDWPPVFAAAVLAVLAFHTRTIGICIMAAGAAILFYRRFWKQGLIYSLVCGLGLLPWVWWQRTHNSAHGYYSAESYYRETSILTGFPWAQKFEILSANLAMLSMSPYYVDVTGQLPWLSIGLAVLVSALTLVGLLRGGRGFAGLAMVGCTAALLLVWTGNPTRFLVPLFPLLIAGFLRGWSLTRLKAWAPWPLSIALISSLIATFQHGTAAEKTGLFSPVRASLDWGELEALYVWIQRSTPPNAIFQANLDPTLYLFTGRKAIRGFQADPYAITYDVEPARLPLGKPSAFLQRLIDEKVDYLVLVPDQFFAETPFHYHFVQRIQATHPHALTVEYTGKNSAYSVWHFHPDAL